MSFKCGLRFVNIRWLFTHIARLQFAKLLRVVRSDSLEAGNPT